MTVPHATAAAVVPKGPSAMLAETTFSIGSPEFRPVFSQAGGRSLAQPLVQLFRQAGYAGALFAAGTVQALGRGGSAADQPPLVLPSEAGGGNPSSVPAHQAVGARQAEHRVGPGELDGGTAERQVQQAGVGGGAVQLETCRLSG